VKINIIIPNVALLDRA